MNVFLAIKHKLTTKKENINMSKDISVNLKVKKISNGFIIKKYKETIFVITLEEVYNIFKTLVDATFKEEN